jgi:hypothetical protein
MFLGSTELASPANFDLAFSLNESNVSDRLPDVVRFCTDVSVGDGVTAAA